MRSVNAIKRYVFNYVFYSVTFATLLLITSCNGICKQALLQKPVPAATCESICQSFSYKNASTKTCELRFLVILPSNASEIEAVHQRVQPVLELASKAIHKQGILPDYVKMVFEHHDDNCDQSLATIAVIDSFNNENEECAHAILGPSCDYPTGGFF